MGNELFKTSATDGAQNNTITNCVTTLNRVNNASGTSPMVDGSVGIAVMNSTPTAATTALTITNAAGSNSSNRFYTNTIQNCNIGMALIGFADVSPFTFADTNNDVGGASVSDWKPDSELRRRRGRQPSSWYSDCGQYNENISFNTINNNNGAGVNHATTLRGIYNNTATSANVTISNNTVTVKSGATTSALIAIKNDAGATAAGNTVSINNNIITGCTYTTATTGTFQGIFNSTASAATVNINNNSFTGNSTNSSGATTFIQQTGAATVAININNNNINGWTFTAANSGTLTGILNSAAGAAAALSINGNDIQNITYSVAGTGANTYINCSAVPLSFTANLNTFTNLNVNTSGTVTFILMTYTQSTATGTKTVTNNSIVTAFNRGGTSGSVLLVSDNGSSVTGVVTTVQNNNFSNITVAGTSTITGLNLTDGGTAPTKNITGNTLSNWTAITGAINAVNVTYWNGASSLSNNTITNLTGQVSVTGITMGSTVNTANPVNVASNTITNLSSTGTGGAVTGITCANTSPVINITSNTINTLSSTGAAAVSGIVVSGAGTTGTTVSKNRICDLSGTNASTTVNGILVSSATTSGAVTLSNNLVGNLTASIATNSNGIIGINITGSATTAARNVYYNTVYLNNPTSGAGFGSSGISTLASATATTSTLNLRNNVIVNTSIQNGAGLTVAYRRSVGTAGTLANYASTSNNNDFYAGTPSASNLIYSDGTSSAQTFAAYKSGAFTAGTIAPRDSASFTESPPFLSTTVRARISSTLTPTIATQLESGGIPIAGITDDFDGDTRNASTPDIGADEFSGILLDLTPPSISYAALGNTNLTGARTLTATITDASGVPTAGIGLPVLYWQINAGGYSGATATSLGGGQYQFSFGSGVTTGDTVSYYVVAQDSAATPNVGSNPSAGASGFTANPPAASTPPTTPNSYMIVPAISGTKTVGVGQDYTDLTAAVTALNGSVITGPVTFLLTDSSYSSGPSIPDAFPLVINANPGSSATNTITIKPAPSVVATISGSAASAALITVKANYVTIDGSNSGGTDRSLTITNTSATSPSVVLFGSTGTTPVTDDTLKNCVIVNGVNTSSAIVISDGTTLGNAGLFANMTIQNNSVQKAFVGVFATGGTIPQGGSNLVYTGNDLTTSGANAIRNVGLYMQGVNGATVSNNTIGNFDAATAENDTGIWLATGTINATVSGNTVSGLSCTASSGAPIGINVTPVVTGNANDVISQNSVSNLATLGSSQIFGISAGNTSGDAITVDRNNVQNIQNNNTGTFGAFGIQINGGNNHVVKNNFVSNINHNMTGGAAFSTTFGVFGISVQTGTGHKVYDNSVNLYGLMPGTATTSLLSAAFALVSTSSTGCDVRDNVFANNITGGTTSDCRMSRPTCLPVGLLR